MICDENKKDINISICLLMLGTIDAIKSGSLSIMESERYIFSIFFMNKKIVRHLKLDKKVVELIHLSTEIEDVESLIPEKLDYCLEDLRQEILETMKLLPRGDTQVKPWFSIFSPNKT